MSKLHPFTTCFIVSWIIFIFFVLTMIVGGIGWAKPAYQFTFVALMNAQNGSEVIPDTYEQVYNEDIIEKTCVLWNQYSDTIKYDFDWWGGSCESRFSHYDETISPIKTLTIIKFIGVFIFSFLFVVSSIKFENFTKLNLLVIILLCLGSACMDVYALGNEKKYYEFASGPLFNISGYVYSDDLDSNITFITDQFDFVQELCKIKRLNSTQKSYAKLTSCEYKGVSYLQSNITVMPFVIVLVILFTIVGIYRVWCRKRNEYDEL